MKDENGNLNPEYLTTFDVFGREQQLGRKVLCIGAGETAIEAAMYLAQNGHDVEMLTRQDVLAKGASQLNFVTMAAMKELPDGTGRMVRAWEVYDNIQGILNATTVKIEGTTVTYIQDGTENTISGDNVIVSGGTSPNVDDALRYAGVTAKFFVIGDANSDQNMQCGIRDAYSKALLI